MRGGGGGLISSSLQGCNHFFKIPGWSFHLKVLITNHPGQNLYKIITIIKVWNILPHHLNLCLDRICCCVAVLLMIFSFLDDISLCMVGQVCQWWHQLAGEQDQWKKHVLTRWPSLFQPANKPSTSWQNLYIKM